MGYLLGSLKSKQKYDKNTTSWQPDELNPLLQKDWTLVYYYQKFEVRPYYGSFSEKVNKT